ncbi:hypothetical protein [Fodinicola feengrottensis]|uniref:hypothetical protein n=1 Tax=Fodinicola feengrottensis TaxID=435914 RepID=UPI0024415F83|nr:hypothetical protein [Fodinicola feengrottensis]
MRKFAAFWYDFVVGDDWRVAVAVVIALALTYGLSRLGLPRLVGAAGGRRARPPLEPLACAAAAVTESRGWLLLVYKVPSEPTRLRATVWRRLKGMGAIYLQSERRRRAAGRTGR